MKHCYGVLFAALTALITASAALGQQTVPAYKVDADPSGTAIDSKASDAKTIDAKLSDGKSAVAPRRDKIHLLPNPVVSDKVDDDKVAPLRPQSSSPAWQFEISPYGWLSGLEGDLRVRNTIVDVDSSASNILKSVDFVFATRAEATKGPWGLFIDENYVNLGQTGNARGPLATPYDVQPTLNIFELGGSYALFTVPAKGGSPNRPERPFVSLEALGGLRWFHLGLGLAAGNSSAEGSRNIIDGFGGNRFIIRPHPNWTLSAKYTLGAGGSHFAWTVNGLVDYRFHNNVSVWGGYQVLDMDADQVENTVGFNGRLRGVILGLSFHR